MRLLLVILFPSIVQILQAQVILDSSNPISIQKDSTLAQA